jgi:pimeloyl-ACP methyl ester carboxylesterase
MDTLLSSASTESAPEAAVNADLPEIVLLPGIMGSHLDAGWRPRAWFNPLTMPFTNLLHSLGLNANGNDANGLAPDGIVSAYYAPAARRWRNLGFRVHEFGYDWRKPLSAAAAALDDFLRNRRREQPTARFVIVAHSMGTLVSAMYSLQTPDWREYVAQAIFCGGPLGGSFAITEMLSGEYAAVKKMAAISLVTSLEELRKMGSTFPGALEMLPDPALFSREGADAEELFRPAAYAPFARPSADWLSSSRTLKSRLRNAPVLGRTTMLVNINLPTSCTFTKSGQLAMASAIKTRGDGTVAARSALVDGVPAYQVTKPHGDLMLDELVIDSVPRLIRGEGIMLELVTPAALNAPLLEAPAPTPEAATADLAQRAAAVRERMRTGLLSTADIRWIMSHE